MAAVLRRDGSSANRKRVKRLMRVMGLEAIYQKPNTSRGYPRPQGRTATPDAARPRLIPLTQAGLPPAGAGRARDRMIKLIVV